MSQKEAGTLTCPSCYKCYKITLDFTPSQLPKHIKKARDAMLVKIQEQLSVKTLVVVVKRSLFLKHSVKIAVH